MPRFLIVDTIYVHEWMREIQDFNSSVSLCGSSCSLCYSDSADGVSRSSTKDIQMIEPITILQLDKPY
jgi:hypothetical protein